AAKYPNMDALLEALDAEGAAALQEIDGFGKVKGEEVAAGLNEMRELIQKLQDVGVKMEAEAKAAATTDIQGLAGMRILITGTVPGQTRESAQAYAEAAGADVASSVSGKLNAVLSGADPGGSKIAKAESLGIPVIDVTEEGSFETICREG